MENVKKKKPPMYPAHGKVNPATITYKASFSVAGLCASSTILDPSGLTVDPVFRFECQPHYPIADEMFDWISKQFYSH